MAEIAQLTFAE
jgi:hypothetical protein